MQAITASFPDADTGWELRFPSLHGRRGYAFPCDSHGCVDMDHMSDNARHNYLYARAMMGRETGWPTVRACGMHA